MKLLSKILLATDFSEASVAATRMAATLAATFGSEILPLHILRELSDLIGLKAVEGVHGLVDGKMCDLAKALTEQGASVVPPVVAHGLPSQQILNHAHAQNSNVIVMGTGARDSNGWFRLGSTAERVIRRSTKPVWVVPSESQTSVRRVVCAVDASDHSRRALTNAVHLARRFDAELTMLTVVEPIQGLLPAEAEVSKDTEVAYAQMISKRFESLKCGLDLHGVSITESIRHGRPADEIVRAANEAKADLLVMGASEKGGFGRLFLGSVAANVLRRAPCAILTLRSDHAVRVEFEAQVDEVKARFAKAEELLAVGFPTEALVELEAVRRETPMAAPVWEALATAHRRLGHETQAAECEARAKYVRETLWKRMVEHEVRNHHDDHALLKYVRSSILGDEQ